VQQHLVQQHLVLPLVLVLVLLAQQVLPLVPQALWAPLLLLSAQQAWPLLQRCQPLSLPKRPGQKPLVPLLVPPADRFDSAPPNAPEGAFFITAVSCSAALHCRLSAFAQAVWCHG
jgi:hypothetical protein